VAVTVYEKSAIFVLIVLARGTHLGERFEGTFRNIRLFIRDSQENDSAWRCAFWLNTKIGDANC
jgi:hypothetical protein